MKDIEGTPTQLRVIRGIEDPKQSYECLIQQVSQDDSLEVAAIIKKFTTIRFSGSKYVTAFPHGMNNLHTQFAKVTANNKKLSISKKHLVVFFHKASYGNNLVPSETKTLEHWKNITTLKVLSHLHTKSPLNSVGDSAIVMAVNTKPTPHCVVELDPPLRSKCGSIVTEGYFST